MSEKLQATRYFGENIHAQSRMPFHVVFGGIGLLLASLFPGGLTGGQGFLIGMIAGIFIPVLATLYSNVTKARRFRLEREVEMVLAKLQIGRAGQAEPTEGEEHGRSRKIRLGESVR